MEKIYKEYFLEILPIIITNYKSRILSEYEEVKLEIIEKVYENVLDDMFPFWNDSQIKDVARLYDLDKCYNLDNWKIKQRKLKIMNIINEGW